MTLHITDILYTDIPYIKGTNKVKQPFIFKKLKTQNDQVEICINCYQTNKSSSRDYLFNVVNEQT